MLPLFGADMGTTLFYGLIVALPAMICAGPLYARLFRNVKSNPITLFVAPLRPESELPSAFNCFASALLPVVIIACSMAVPLRARSMAAAAELLDQSADRHAAVGLAVATYTLGLSRGMKMQPLMDDYGNSVKDIAVILLIIAGAGTLKEVFVATGVDKNISALLTGIAIDPLVLGWLIAGVIRVSLGSATVAGLTAAGLMAPVVATANVDPNLMVLAIGAGSLMFSHVNDSGLLDGEGILQPVHQGNHHELDAHGRHRRHRRHHRRARAERRPPLAAAWKSPNGPSLGEAKESTGSASVTNRNTLFFTITCSMSKWSVPACRHARSAKQCCGGPQHRRGGHGQPDDTAECAHSVSHGSTARATVSDYASATGRPVLIDS